MQRTAIGRSIFSFAPRAPLAVALLSAVFATGYSGCGAEGEGEGEGEGDDQTASCGSDESLGGLRLAPGFAVTDSVLLPDDIFTVGLSELSSGTGELFALTQDMVVESLGTFPDLTTDAPRELFDAIAPEDVQLVPGSDLFPSFLVVSGDLIGTGYTRASDFGGFLGQHHIAAGTSEFKDAPLNFSASAGAEFLFVNSGGLGALQGGLGVYAAGSGSVFQVAAFGEDAVASGFTAATANGVLVVGQFSSENELFALSPAAVAAARTSGTPVNLGQAVPLFAGSVGAVSPFGDGVGVVGLDANYTGRRLDLIALSADGDSVSVGAPAPVLEPDEECTAIAFAAPFGADIVVGLRDERGLRAVVIRKL